MRYQRTRDAPQRKDERKGTRWKVRPTAPQKLFYSLRGGLRRVCHHCSRATTISSSCHLPSPCTFHIPTPSTPPHPPQATPSLRERLSRGVGVGFGWPELRGEGEVGCGAKRLGGATGRNSVSGKREWKWKGGREGSFRGNG